jgi:hypothetical protein
MANYTKDNLLSLTPEKVPSGTLAVKIGEEVFTAGNVKIRGIDPAATTATVDDVLIGKKFFNAKGELQQGVLDAIAKGTTSFFKCAEVFGTNNNAILVSGAGYVAANGIYMFEDANAVGLSKVWRKKGIAKDYLITYNGDDETSCECALKEIVKATGFEYMIYHSHEIGNILNPWEYTWYADFGEYNPAPQLQHFATYQTPDCVWIDFNDADNRMLSGGFYLINDTENTRIWKHYKDEGVFLKQNYLAYNSDREAVNLPWAITRKSSDSEDILYYSYSETAFPWDTTNWYHTTAGSSVWDDPSFYTVQEMFFRPAVLPRDTPLRWSGYKAVLKVRPVIKKVNTYLEVDFGHSVDIPDKYPENGTPARDGGDFVLTNYSLTDGNRVFVCHSFLPGEDAAIYWDGSGWQMKILYKDGSDTAEFIGPRINSIEPVGVWDFSGSGWDFKDGWHIVTSQWREENAHYTETQEYYWEFEETLTEGLTWGNGFTPQVGRIYNEEATIVSVLSEPAPLLSSPENMTNYENDEWKVWADYEFADTKAWWVFDNSIGTQWWDAGNGNLIWQNKTRAVLVRQLSITYRPPNGSDGTYNFSFYGSNNGTDWTEIAAINSLQYEVQEDGSYKTVVTFPQNKTPYFYHRFYGNRVSMTRNVIGTLVAKATIDGEFDASEE